MDDFEFKLLIICFDEDMNTYEIEYIRKYNTLVPSGYNLREGGNNGKHHEETKKKISTTLKNKTLIYAKPQLRIPHTQEVKDKIRQKMKGRVPASIHKLIERSKRLAKPIIQFTSDGSVILARYESSASAGIAMNVAKASIHRACKSKSKIYLGFKWMYETECLDKTFEK